MTSHIAQLNIGRFRYAPDDPRMAAFVTNLDRINALAERSEEMRVGARVEIRPSVAPVTSTNPNGGAIDCVLTCRWADGA